MEVGQQRKVVKIIQARTSSSRLPNKVLMDIHGTSLLERVINQTRKIKYPGQIWVATSEEKEDLSIELICDRLGVNCYRGNLDDVRSRFLNISKICDAEIIVRITGDNPLTEPRYIDDMIDFMIANANEVDYIRMKKDLISDGTGAEVFSFRKFKELSKRHNTVDDLEHVTPALIQFSKIAELVPTNENLVLNNPLFLGVDKYEDLLKVNRILSKYKTLEEIIKSRNERKI
jgi:spore coat polysaccharide biosynthesis protein SpsF (cytidylyltransferase family)